MWWILVAIFLSIVPRKVGLKAVTGNFTNFFTAREKKFVTWNSLWEHPRLKCAGFWGVAIFRSNFQGNRLIFSVTETSQRSSQL